MHSLWNQLIDSAKLVWLLNLEREKKVIRATSRQNQQSDCVPSEDSDQPVIRVFAIRMKKVWVLSYPLSAQRRLWSGWVDAPADLSLHWAHTHFTPSHKKWWDVMLYPPTILSVRPTALCPDSNLSSFWPIWDCKRAKFIYKQQSYGPWLM